eukprot:g33538.t1
MPVEEGKVWDLRSVRVDNVGVLDTQKSMLDTSRTILCEPRSELLPAGQMPEGRKAHDVMSRPRAKTHEEETLELLDTYSRTKMSLVTGKLDKLAEEEALHHLDTNPPQLTLLSSDLSGPANATRATESEEEILDTTTSVLDTKRSELMPEKYKSKLMPADKSTHKEEKASPAKETKATPSKTVVPSPDDLPKARWVPDAHKEEKASPARETKATPSKTVVPSPDDLPKARWVPDEEREACNGCKSQFGWFLWRHHCRFCGEVYCRDCSDTDREDGLRICELCKPNPPNTRSFAPKRWSTRPLSTTSIRGKRDRGICTSQPIRTAGLFFFPSDLTLNRLRACHLYKFLWLFKCSPTSIHLALVLAAQTCTFAIYSYVALGRFVVYRSFARYAFATCTVFCSFYVEFTLYSFLLELHLTCYVQLFRRTTAISLH